MKTKTNLLLVGLAVFTALATFCLSSCNTIRGAGRDVENVGSAVARTPGP